MAYRIGPDDEGILRPILGLEQRDRREDREANGRSRPCRTGRPRRGSGGTASATRPAIRGSAGPALGVKRCSRTIQSEDQRRPEAGDQREQEDEAVRPAAVGRDRNERRPGWTRSETAPSSGPMMAPMVSPARWKPNALPTSCGGDRVGQDRVPKRPAKALADPRQRLAEQDERPADGECEKRQRHAGQGVARRRPAPCVCRCGPSSSRRRA